MIKEIIIVVTALLALSQAASTGNNPKENVAIPVDVEVKEDVQESDDLKPEASAWGGRGRGHGGWGGGHGGWGGGHGGWGGGRRHWG